MKKIVIIRGPQGSGKSRLIAHLCLEGHALSYDTMRDVVSGAWLNTKGELVRNQEKNQLVRQLVLENLELRMNGGETIAFEATMPKARDVQNIVAMARRHRYEIAIIDLFGTPLKECQANNYNRPDRTRVPPEAITRCHESAEKADASWGKLIKLCSMADLDWAAPVIDNFLRQSTEIVDLSGYEQIIHIGDIQGCHWPLESPEAPFYGRSDTSKAYIFVGDLFDRGPENGKVARWWLDQIGKDAPNVWLIAGNHELHVHRHLAGLPPVSREWSERTLPQLKKAGITEEDLKTIMSYEKPLLDYIWRDTRVLVTHGGLAARPSELHLVPEIQLMKGVGHFNDPIDEAWARNEANLRPDNPGHQVHGHRNSAMLPVRASTCSWNLEGQVEFGGHMRFCILDEKGWTPIEIRNNGPYRTMHEDHAINKAAGRPPISRTAPVAPWIARGKETIEPIDTVVIDAMKAHDMINEHVSTTMPGLASLNFSRTAFQSRTWDEATMRARGLFIDTHDGTIVAKGRNKFFNHHEMPETSDAQLKQNIQFPVHGYAKENGFFGLVGYSKRHGRLVTTSKSRIEGDFADMLRETLLDNIGNAGIELATRYCRDFQACLMLEVNQPFRDPHMIRYDKPHVVLLAAIRRHQDFEEIPYDDLCALAKLLGCAVKQRIFSNIPNWTTLQNVMSKVENDQTWHASKPIEGIVWEDASGFAWKSKSIFYSTWKKRRSAVERMALTRRKNILFDIQRYATEPETVRFLKWAEQQPDDVLAKDIIWLREAYEANPEDVIILDMPPPGEKTPDQTGFLKGVDALAAQIGNGTAKPQSAQRMLERALECQHRQAAFDAHPASSAIREFVHVSNEIEVA